MTVQGLVLEDFRNIGALRLEPGAGVNVICGDNAQGKTNLLEAIWLFCGDRSFRGAKAQELVAFDKEYARLSMDFFAGGRAQEAELVFGCGERRAALNGVRQRRASELAGVFCAVAFSPDQLSMVKLGPEVRRRFLDTALCQLLPKYRKVLESYERILRQRARLLRDAAFHRQLLDTLDAWDRHLVQYGGYITAVRARYAARLHEAAQAVYAGISQDRENFSVSYMSSAMEIVPDDRDACTAQLAQAVRDSRAEDLRAGATTLGPHRDDLHVEVDGRGARQYASQGQQRSCVLALKLAECELVAESAGEPPVVLLDDVMSELDEGRRAYLLNRLDGRQVFITCCDERQIGRHGGRSFRMEGGVLVAEN